MYIYYIYYTYLVRVRKQQTRLSRPESFRKSSEVSSPLTLPWY
jgi:hypothetical protein